MRNKQIISEETLTTWITLSALAAMCFIVTASICVYLIYGCWPWRSIQTGNVDCVSDHLPSWIYLLPAIFGSITGTYLTKLHIRKTVRPPKK